MESTIFAALSEPSRLRIVELLKTRPMSVNEISEALSIRQPQVSKHLRVLGDSGIVTGEALARQRIYHLEAEPFEQIGNWLESFEQLWDVRLDSLGSFLESITPDEPH
jgi:DNA-binding transcriptional ArsR family regulator